MRPLVSVLVPGYNHAQFVGETIDSVAAQDYDRVEVLVLDDGSSDGTADAARLALARHAGRFERAEVWGQPNAGIPRTLNRLLDASQGEVAMPLASDDLLLPGGVRQRVEMLSAHPEALALFTDCVVIDDHGGQVYESGIRDFHGGNPSALATNRHLAASLVRAWCVPGGVLSLRRESFEAADGPGRFNEALIVEDFDLYLRLAVTGRLRFDPTPTSAYRLHGGQSIHRVAGQMSAQAAHTLLWVSEEQGGLARAFARERLRPLVSGYPLYHPRRIRYILRDRFCRALYRHAVGHSVHGERRPAMVPPGAPRG